MLPEYSNLNPIFLEYANDVMSGAIVACNNIKLACKRYLDWFDRTDIEFRPEMVQKKIDFVNKMKHWQGPYAGKHFNLLPFQVWIFCNIFGWYYRETNKRVTRNVFIFVGRKNAKAISLDTNIPTPSGNRLLRDIHEGDIIFGADGKPTTVLQESEIYYNPCYKIVFENGEEIISADNHRWYVKHRKSQKFVVKTTQEMYDEGIYHLRKDCKGKEYNYRTLLTEPVQYEAKDYIVDPYVLGLWLGDGSTGAPEFATQYKHDDYKIYDYVTKLYGEPTVYVDNRNNNVVTLKYNNTRINKHESKLSSDLIKIGVFHNKHIPSEYKYGSVELRLSLILGLMDTDGCCNKSGYHQCSITLKKIDIIHDMQEILSSLGIKSQIKTSYVTLNGNKCGPYYRLLFYTDKTMPVFRMKRKYERLPEQLHKRMKYNTIKDIIPCETVPCKCLMVDNKEHLFLCGNQYTVTHNTSMAAAISLACMCKDGEQGAEVNLIANNRKQALIAFEDCQNYSRSLDPKHKYLTVYRDSIKFSKTNSKLQVLASDSMGLDGYRSHMFLIDEFHAAKTWDLYNVMKRSQGVQENPLAIIITTAGYLQSGYPCYDMRIACIDILRGFKQDDSQFSAIYELDEGDDWLDENVWIKANPSLGVALRKDAVLDYVTLAINVPSTLFDTLTKQFNIFMGSKNVWIKDKYILNSSVLIDLEDFRGETCYMGVDLSAVSDLTSWTVLFPPNPDRDKYPDKFVFKTFAYVPLEALDSENGQKYKEWILREQLHMTSGNAVDYDKILLDLQNIIEQYELCCYKVSYDSYNATLYATNALSVGLPMEAFSLSLGSFNRPTKGFEILMLNDKVILDMNLVTKWCFQNAELKEDFNNNCLSLDTLVPTTNGFKEIKDILVGDYVFDEKGLPTKVISTTDINYNRDCYKITFQNGGEVISDYLHRWYIETPTCRKKNGKVIKQFKEYTYRTTEWLYNHLTNNLGNKVRHTMMCEPLQYSHKELPIDPYVLGLWLGDGCHLGSTFAVHKDDEYIYKEYVEPIYGEPTKRIDHHSENTYILYYKNGLRTQLRENNLLLNKHIPEIYFESSVELRLSLLLGLMDTDGGCNKITGLCQFTQKRKNIIDGVVLLLDSLGIKHSKIREFYRKGYDNTYYSVTFVTDIPVFRLERKKSRLHKSNNNHNVILDIQKVDSVPTKCITVESEKHLFLVTKNYVVTGNCKPIKPNNNQDKARKIDCVISIVQALGGFLIDLQYGYESTTATDSNE